MNILKKIFNCSRGYHEVARSYLNVSGQQCLVIQPGAGVPITYFRCAHCLGLFGVAGSAESVPNTKAVALKPEKMSQDIVDLLVKQPWWPCLRTPEPWPAPPKKWPLDIKVTVVPSGGLHGGPIPGIPEGADLQDPEIKAKVEAMLPQGAQSSVMEPPPFSPASDSAKIVEDLRRAASQWEEGIWSAGGDPHTAKLGLPEPKKTPPMPTVPEPKRDPFWDVVCRAQKIIDDYKAERIVSAERQKVKDQIYSGITRMISLLGTCCRLQVGCVLLTFDGKVAGMGYNGSGPGMPHCTPETCNDTCRCSRTVHAEINALSNCSGVPHTAYVTAEPCCACAKELILAGIRRVVYTEVYTSIADGERAARQEWINHYGVKWEHLPSPTQEQP